MRTPVIAGNWKCNLRLDSAYQLANGLRERIEDIEGVEKIVCPPFIYLATVEVALSMSSIKVGAQDVHWEDDVAATGEVGPAQLEELVDFVIIGHSERRHQLGETDEMVSRKVKAALSVGLQPIMCVGETLEERQAGKTAEVIVRQTRSGLEGLSPSDGGLPEGFIIAYEPVWAIGTGTAATAGDAEEAIALVRREVASLFGDEKAEATRILYGGSVTPENITEFMSREGIDGALVGGASLKVDSFAGIVEEAARVRAAG
ncbi:MAG: triose-phosphate isomerase [Chloroflexi bacterium]|nr:MAG: triose-phosphate isomerase [Chloroflexota bacterium]